ncbi:MAG: L-2-hydroxyglutarate oxidase [Deltaproteobacteria bacterium]|nr:L-2-hydroxyglutarate oxidase [Deltaproteobacteria bacterium]
MSSPSSYDVAIIGGGIVGCATALALSEPSPPPPSLIVVEAEQQLAAHQTGHNSGVIHSGLYYKPGSLKAWLCVEGRGALIRFCEEQGIAHERCGKVVVATAEEELPALAELERRGRANGLTGLARLDPAGIAEHEPHVRGIAGLWVPQTGIVDYTAVTEAFARVVQERGGELRLGARVTGLARSAGELVLETTGGEVHCRNLINCSGLHCDQVARLCGVVPGLQILPFRGEYYELVEARRHLVRNLVYPVPDPSFPFLGVHFTRMIRGGVEAGPNAVLSFKREGYGRFSFSLPDMMRFTFSRGFWRMAGRHWRMGLHELWRSFSKRAFVEALRQLVPELTLADVHRSGAGVRAQALEPDGALVDDFRIVQGERMVHVLNAPSPAATASIAIGRSIARQAEATFDLPGRRVAAA